MLAILKSAPAKAAAATRLPGLVAGAMTAVLLIAVASGSFVTQAAAESLKDQGGDVETFPFWGDQRGCYWERGRRYCSSYCYWETNGRRYCRDRESRAHPQGDPGFVPYPPEPPIYARPRYARPW